MPKIFKIETRKGWACLPERIGSYNFPLTMGSLQGATEFFSKTRAEKMMAKYNLKNAPYHAHIEEFEWEPEKAWFSFLKSSSFMIDNLKSNH